MKKDSATGWMLLGIGGAHMDRIGHIYGSYHAGASNPGRLTTTVGGGTLNALRTACLAGTGPVALISARGGDHDGAIVADTVEAAGLGDLSAVFLDRRTASYTAILDASGEQIAGLADMEIYETALPRQLRRKALREAIASANAILVDANLPVAGLEAAAGHATGPIFAIAISPTKVLRLTAIAARIDTIFMNRREMKALTSEDSDAPGLAGLAALGFNRAVVTGGAGPVLVQDAGTRHEVSPPALDAVVDVTGAGDALAGATIHSLLRDPGLALCEAGRFGIAAAQMTLRTEGPVAETLSGPEPEAIRAACTIREMQPSKEGAT